MNNIITISGFAGPGIETVNRTIYNVTGLEFDFPNQLVSIKVGSIIEQYGIDQLANVSFSNENGNYIIDIGGESGGGGSVDYIRVATPITVTDAQIAAGTIVQILAPTEVLGYSGVPTQLPIPVWAWAMLDSSAGAYIGIDVANADSGLDIVWGSDWSLTAAVAWKKTDNEPSGLGVCGFGDSHASRLISFNCSFLYDMPATLAAAFEDNGLYIKVRNNSGTLTGGNAANSMLMSVGYVLLDTTTLALVPVS